MRNFITMIFTNEMETIQVGANTSFERFPTGTFLTDIANADVEYIASRISSCKTGVSVLEFDSKRFVSVFDSLCTEYPHIFPIFYNGTITDIWSECYNEFCQRDYSGNLIAVNAHNELNRLLSEILTTPKLLSYDFLEYLNLTNMILPTSVAPCTLRFDPCHTFERQVDVNSSLEDIYTVYVGTLSETQRVYDVDFSSTLVLPYIAVCSLLEVARANRIIKKCSNCGKYFIPENRSDTLYCDNYCPQDQSMTCKEYGTRRLWYLRQKEDPVEHCSRRIASVLSMRAKRNPDIKDHLDNYEYFKNQRRAWREDIKSGKRTRDQFLEWLLDIQNIYGIKGVNYGID